MKNMPLYLFFYMSIIPFHCISHTNSISPLTYLFLTNVISCTEPSYKAEDGKQKERKSYGDRFLLMFQESLHDGFFGGVKWGIAACFYQVLYELSGGVVSVVPTTIHFLKNILFKAFNALSGKPDPLSVRELSIIAQFFHDSMHNFNKRATSSLLCQQDKKMIKDICTHIIDYLKKHYAHYKDTGSWNVLAHVTCVLCTYNTQEVAFVISLLVQHLQDIIHLINETTLCVDQIMYTSHITLQRFHTLKLLLKDKTETNENTGGVFDAWFSNEPKKTES